jgi:hypothetical protein
VCCEVLDFAKTVHILMVVSHFVFAGGDFLVGV